MKSSLVIIHFSPIELYPPIQNLVRTIEGGNSESEITVLSTRKCANTHVFRSRKSNIKLYRLAKSGNELSSIKRYLNYIFFYVSSLVILLLKRPKSILYFETISSWPVYIYKRFINKTCKIYIHFHEYVSSDEYKSGTILLQYFHFIEKWLLPTASWVSHTNKYRLNLFIKDISPIKIQSSILPNYPPKAWQTSPHAPHSPTRIVYAGALGMDTMYVNEFADWVIQHQNFVIWDIYSNNLQPEVVDYFNDINAPNVCIKEALPYEQLPHILKDYDVGVVLYNGHIPNYVYNAPNKLFEYIVCGLDVWFPRIMEGSLQFVTQNHYPKVMALDFTQLSLYHPINLIDRSGMSFKDTDYCCEFALAGLINELEHLDV